MWVHLLLACLLVTVVSLKPAFRRKGAQGRTGFDSVKKTGSTRLNMHPAGLDGASSALIAAGADYASEIENAVGEEIYGPIFQAGIFLFVSGIVAAFGVAFIVSKSDSWDDLEEEFDAGKQKQLIVSDAETAVTAANEVSEREAAQPSLTSATEVDSDSGVGDLDL